MTSAGRRQAHRRAAGQCAGRRWSPARVLALRRSGRRHRRGWGSGAAGPGVREHGGASARECGAAECVEDGPLGAGGEGDAAFLWEKAGSGREGAEAGTLWEGQAQSRAPCLGAQIFSRRRRGALQAWRSQGIPW